MSSSRDKSSNSRRIQKACERCRRQKTKCSGQQPCDYCERRNLPCSFAVRDQTVVVSRGYIEDLTSKLRLLEGHERPAGVLQRQFALPAIDTSSSSFPANVVNQPSAPLVQLSSHQPGSVRTVSQSTISPHSIRSKIALVVPGEATTAADQLDPDEVFETGLSNPMATSWAYATDGAGRTHYLGTSSNWSFACKAISIAHEKVLGTAFAADALLFDGTAYLSGWEELQILDKSRDPTIPSRDHSLHLLRSVDFHLGSLFHLYDEQSFMLVFDQYHESGSGTDIFSRLWYVHYLTLLALGKAFVVHKIKPSLPPGTELYARAQRMLPDVIALSQIPINATEVLCCMAVYLQALDFRNAAFNFIGQAKRIALFEGFHTNMQGRNLNDKDAERCRRIWWTIYVLDHQMTALIGVPSTLKESAVNVDLPEYNGSGAQVQSLGLHVQISRTMAEIIDTVYGPEDRLDSHFLASMKSTLASVAELVPTLHEQHPFSPTSFTEGLSRITAHLHLLHYQCIVLATRPLLLTCFSKLVAGQGISSSPQTVPNESIQSMLRICVDAARQVMAVLAVLQNQSLIETFLPFDLEATFSSAIVLIMARLLWQDLRQDDDNNGTRIAHSVLEEMIAKGNIVAQSRENCLHHFERLLIQLATTSPESGAHAFRSPAAAPSVFHGAVDLAPAESTATKLATQQQSHSQHQSDFDFDFLTNSTNPNNLSAVHLQDAADAFSARDLDWFNGV